MKNRVQPWACLLLAAAVAVAGCRARPEWTTDSEEALAELEQGLDAAMKVYVQDANAHFERALELDPDFVAAKLFSLDYRMESEGREQLLEDLRTAERDGLSERERFLLDHTLAIADGDSDAAEQMRHDYLEKHPEDPWALAICSRSAWLEQDLEQAEHFYRELLEANPNWVLAQNHLGYLAMARGDFATAEERFRTYAFIAPDQANPHDSLGELLTLLGRYDEAQAELEEALTIKSDFCHSYMWLQMIEILRGDPPASWRWIDGARGAGCPQEFVVMLECQLEVWQAYEEQEWDAPWSGEWGEGCHEWVERHHLVHRMALYTGRADEAVAIEERISEAAEGDEAQGEERKIARAMLLHLQGFRALFEGDGERAVERLTEADRLLTYWGGNQAVVKLYNKMHLALALEEIGDLERRDAVVAEVEKINPAFASFYRPLKEQMARTSG